MAKPELSLIEERDETQRALGCVGLSAFAHLGLLIFVLIAPSLRDSSGIASGSKAGLELPGETIVNAAPAGNPQGATSTANEPVEVMLADANDPNAVALPTTPPPAQPAEVQPVKSVKPAIETADISSALTNARTEAAKAPAKPAKVAAAAPIETAPESEVAAPIAQEVKAEVEQETPVAQEDAQADEEEEAVPLQVALPESESLTQAQANALQAPSAKNEIPADAQPIETVPSAAAPSATTGAVITRPANANPVVATNSANGLQARGLPASAGTAGTTSGMTQSRGGTQDVGVPFGSQVRDARTLQAMPGNPLATYPLPDRIANREGTTVLLGHVRNDGRVENVSLEKSSGSRLMDESAAKAFSQWKYRPGQEGYVRLPMQFKLVGDAHVIPAELKRQ